jgi:hypothetical protein
MSSVMLAPTSARINEGKLEAEACLDPSCKAALNSSRLVPGDSSLTGHFFNKNTTHLSHSYTIFRNRVTNS